MAETTGETLLNPAMGRAFTPSGTSPVRDFVRRLWHSRLAGVGIVIVGMVIVAAIFAPLIAPYDPIKINSSATLQPPSIEHLLGTDHLGRDIFSRILYGGQVSLRIQESGRDRGSRWQPDSRG